MASVNVWKSAAFVVFNGVIAAAAAWTIGYGLGHLTDASECSR